MRCASTRVMNGVVLEENDEIDGKKMWRCGDPSLGYSPGMLYVPRNITGWLEWGIDDRGSGACESSDDSSTVIHCTYCGEEYDVEDNRAPWVCRCGCAMCSVVHCIFLVDDLGKREWFGV